MGDGDVIGWKDPRSVNQRDTSQPERQNYTLTPMRKGLFATAAGTTLKNAGLIVDYLYELIKPACKGTVIFIILTPVSLVKKTCPGISGVLKICAFLLSVSPVSPLLIIFSHHWAFQLVPQPGGIVPPKSSIASLLSSWIAPPHDLLSLCFSCLLNLITNSCSLEKSSVTQSCAVDPNSLEPIILPLSHHRGLILP